MFAFTYHTRPISFFTALLFQAKREEYDLDNATHVEHADNLETSSLGLRFVAIDKVSGSVCTVSTFFLSFFFCLSIGVNHQDRLKQSTAWVFFHWWHSISYSQAMANLIVLLFFFLFFFWWCSISNQEWSGWSAPQQCFLPDYQKDPQWAMRQFFAVKALICPSNKYSGKITWRKMQKVVLLLLSKAIHSCWRLYSSYHSLCLPFYFPFSALVLDSACHEQQTVLWASLYFTLLYKLIE